MKALAVLHTQFTTGALTTAPTAHTRYRKPSLPRMERVLGLFGATSDGEIGPITQTRYGVTGRALFPLGRPPESRVPPCRCRSTYHDNEACPAVAWAFSVLDSSERWGLESPSEMNRTKRLLAIDRAKHVAWRSFLTKMACARSDAILIEAREKQCSVVIYVNAPSYRTTTFGHADTQEVSLVDMSTLARSAMFSIGIPKYECPACGWVFDDEAWLNRLRKYQSKHTGISIDRIARVEHRALVEAGCAQPTEVYRDHPITRGTRLAPATFVCPKCAERSAPHIALLAHALRQAGFENALKPDSRKAEDVILRFSQSTRKRVGA